MMSAYYTAKAQNRTFEAAKSFIDAALKIRFGHSGEPPALKKIQIAGTNGKGSTSSMLACILSAAGYKTGLYTSPSLLCVNERIAIDGKMITDAELCSYIDTIRTAEAQCGMQYGGFDRITAAANMYFIEKGVDFAVMETGLGGRFDTVSAVEKTVLASITSIGMDHTQMLGNTIEEIANDKCGIMRKGVPIICHSQTNEAMDTILKNARRMDSPLICTSDCQITQQSQDAHGQAFKIICGDKSISVAIPMLGSYQPENATNAILCAIELERLGLADIGMSAMINGLKATRVNGRMQTINLPFMTNLLLLDGAHNPHAVRALGTTLSYIEPSAKYTVLLSVLKTKDASGIINELKQFTNELICVQANRESAEIKHLMGLAEAHGITSYAADSIKDGLVLAERVSSEGKIIATGSFYLVAEILRLSNKLPNYN